MGVTKITWVEKHDVGVRFHEPHMIGQNSKMFKGKNNFIIH